jgi:hypothetical protein
MAKDSPCGDWESYKDEKCLKIIDETLRTYDDAEKICNQQENSASLVIIRSKDEQDFLSNLLFNTHKVLDNVWIGVKYTSNMFKWIDDSDLSFTNWAEGNPRNKTDNTCVQMQSDVDLIGKWTDEPCGRKNLVVCQKMQNWPISLLQKTLLDVRKYLTEEKNERINSFNDVKKELEDTKKQLNNLQQNPVPIGFIHVQLPSQPEPKILWPMVEWKDVTSDYAGLFFRVEGGGSAAFGETQNETSPRLIAVEHNSENICDQQYKNLINIDEHGEWSEWFNLSVFSYPYTYRDCMRFKASSGEVRPRNKAIRIWKRIK